MKQLLCASLTTIALISCQSTNNDTEVSTQEYMSFGDSTFAVDDALSAAALLEKFELAGDTLHGTVAGEITRSALPRDVGWQLLSIQQTIFLSITITSSYCLPTAKVNKWS